MQNIVITFSCAHCNAKSDISFDQIVHVPDCPVPSLTKIVYEDAAEIKRLQTELNDSESARKVLETARTNLSDENEQLRSKVRKLQRRQNKDLAEHKSRYRENERLRALVADVLYSSGPTTQEWVDEAGKLLGRE